MRRARSQEGNKRKGSIVLRNRIVGLLALVLAFSFVTALPAAAETAPRMALAEDGYVYAYTESGVQCRWAGPAPFWGSCEKNVNIVINNGFLGGKDKVNLFWDTNMRGAWACIGRGDIWSPLKSGQWIFSWGPDLPGYWESVYNNIASSEWTSRCGSGTL